MPRGFIQDVDELSDDNWDDILRAIGNSKKKEYLTIATRLRGRDNKPTLGRDLLDGEHIPAGTLNQRLRVRGCQFRLHVPGIKNASGQSTTNSVGSYWCFGLSPTYV